MTTALPTRSALHVSTKTLLNCGIAAGPMFITVVLIQELTRAGFDPRRHPLSLLSLTDLGWIQITNFLVAGALAVAGAVGLRRVLGGGPGSRWAPILFGAYGAGLLVAGVFLTDPFDGYPAGTPAGLPEHISWHSNVHSIGPVAAIWALIVACFVLARRFTTQRQPGWAAYCIITAIATLALSAAAFAGSSWDFRLLFSAGALVWLWSAIVTAQLRS